MIETTTLTKLIQDYGLGIALVIVIVGLLVWNIRESRNERRESVKQLEKKDAENKELRDKVIELQEKTIVSSEKLANNIAVNTEVTKRVDSHLETQGRVTETLITSVNAVLSQVRK